MSLIGLISISIGFSNTVLFKKLRKNYKLMRKGENILRNIFKLMRKTGE
jgi:hypothetical protein